MLVSTLKHMEERQEDSTQEKRMCKRFFSLGYSGRHYIRIVRRTTRFVILANGWVVAQPVKDCTATTAKKNLFEYVLTRF